MKPFIEYFFIISKKDYHPKIRTKSEYKPFIRECFAIDDYRVTEANIQSIINNIKEGGIDFFLNVLSKVSTDPHDLPSSNIIEMIELLRL